MQNTPDYKNTIRLPQTAFPMKGDLPIKEPQIIAGWEKNQVYQKMQEKNKNNPGFTLPDGHPTPMAQFTLDMLLINV